MTKLTILELRKSGKSKKRERRPVNKKIVGTCKVYYRNTPKDGPEVVAVHHLGLGTFRGKYPGYVWDRKAGILIPLKNYAQRMEDEARAQELAEVMANKDAQ